MTHKRNRNKTDDQLHNIRARKEALNQNWSQIEDIYQATAQGIVDISVSLNSAIQTIAASGQVNPSIEIITTINAIKQDIELFVGDLKSIHSQHAQYSGKIKNENELALCLSVFTDYQNLFNKFKAITFSPMLTVTEYLSEIQTNQAASQSS